MLLTDDPVIAKLVSEEKQCQFESIKWFYTDQILAVSAGYVVRSKLHGKDEFISTFASKKITEQVASFMNENSTYFQPDEHPEVLGEKLAQAVATGWLTIS